MLTKPIITLNNVSKTYQRGSEKIFALRQVNVQIQESEFVAVTGPSGGGKSTLLQVTGGLDQPSEGIVEVNGINLGSLSDVQLSDFRNQQLGFIFQLFYLQPFLTVGQNIALPAVFSKEKVSRQERLQELAALVGLTDRIDHRPNELSGGQVQRCSIARALFNRPKILLADEPTGNLDSENADKVIELFRDIKKTLGTTIVMVTHDSSLAARADRVVSIKDGVVQ